MPYTYVLVRTDIALHQQTVQACHAALEAGFVFNAPARISSLIVLTVPNEAALLAARDRLSRHGIDCEVFFEPDGEMGHSALCTQPVFTKKQRKELARYPMFSCAKSIAQAEPSSLCNE